MSGKFSAVQKLNKSHNVKCFDCGNLDLNNFVTSYARQNQEKNAATTFVICIESDVVGFYSLATASISPASATQSAKKGMPRHDIPAMLIARLAVDKNYQNSGLGKALLKDALLRGLVASSQIGIRCVLVHAKDAGVAGWYEKFGFEPSPTDALHLILLMSEIQNAFGTHP